MRRRAVIVVAAVLVLTAALFTPDVASGDAVKDTVAVPDLAVSAPSPVARAATRSLHAVAPLSTFPTLPSTAAVKSSTQCAVGPRAPAVHFEQVKTYVGAVAAEDLRVAMVELRRCFEDGATAAPLSASGVDWLRGNRAIDVDAYAMDGTLLNLLRWGRIVNDNDIDVGVIARGVPAANVSEHYYATMRRLVRCGFVDAPTVRQAKKLHDQHKVVKPRRCLLRPQMMQCRHRNGVIIDIFGPETVFSSLTGLVADKHVFPLRRCRAFDSNFPCPREPIISLKQFTMQFPDSTGGKVMKPQSTAKAWYEFAGCALLPLRAAEQDAPHVRSILADAQGLESCGFPSLLPDALAPPCADLIRRAGVELPTLRRTE